MRGLPLALAFYAALLPGESSQLYTALPGFRAADASLWHDPGQVEARDFRYGPGGETLQPRPPFTFLKEDLSGTNPKVRVRDGNGRTWVIKFGDEARPDTFSSRLAWAVGYYAEPNYYLAGEVIRGAQRLQRARRSIAPDGRAAGGRFQLRSKYPEYMDGYSWGWRENPFAGTPQLGGLKILMMLVSNWDDKDIQDEDLRGLRLRYRELLYAMKQGSNNAIYKESGRYLFFIDDWGASLGHWGQYLARSKWDCVDYYDESRNFIRGVRGGRIEWGYKGLHTARMAEGIRVSDVRWLLQYLGRVTDAQLRTGLLASGATPDEADFYVEALRMRIRELQDVAEGRPPLVAGRARGR